MKRKSVLTFPNLKENINWKFTVYLRLLKLIHTQIIKGEIISKRQLYYADVKLFKKQTIVDECLDNIALSFNLSIEKLNIIASQKGLIYGELSIDNYKISKSIGSTLIPVINLSSSLSDSKIIFNNNENSSPDSIIILEKDAILSGLINIEKSNKHLTQKFNNSILITARGYPDRLTKHFINILTIKFNKCKIYGYFDSDVYGFMIALEYSSKPMNNNTSLPCVSNMIIKGAKLFDNNVKYSDLIPLNDKDISTSMSLLNRLKTYDDTTLDSLNSSIKNLQRSLYFGFKRELKIVDIN